MASFVDRGVSTHAPKAAEHVRLLHNLSAEEQELVSRFTSNHTFAQGRTILREGERDQSLWVIQEGRCVVVKTLQNGCEQQFAVLNSGAVFGELSFVEPAPHSMSIRALEKVDVMRIRREDFDRLVQIDAFLAFKLLSNAASETAARVRRMNRYTLDLFERSGTAARVLAQTTEERDLLKTRLARTKSELSRLKILIGPKKPDATVPNQSRRRWLRAALLGIACSGLVCVLAEAILVNEQATGWCGMLFGWLERIGRVLPQLI